MNPRTIGRYRILGPLDGAGSGRALKVYDEALLRNVVLRALFSSNAPPDARHTAAVLARVQAAAALVHPGLAPIHDVVHDDDGDWMAREFVDGDNLGEVLTRPDATDPRLALQLALDLARAVEHCHANGLTHDNLGPDAVIVTPAGRAVIVDLGVHCQAPGASDEQDRRTDLEALRSLVSALLERIAAARPALEALPDTVAAEQRELVDRIGALATELGTGEAPAAAMLCARLEPLLAGLHRLSSGEATGRSLSRWWLLQPAGVLVVALLGLLATAAAAFLIGHHRNRPEPVFVAVPVPVADRARDEVHADHLEATVHMAVVNTLAELDQVQVLHPRHLGPGTATPAQVLAATAADEVLTSSVTFEGGDCQVRLRRLAGPDLHTSWQATFQAPAHNLLLLADTISAYLRQGFAERDARESVVPIAARAQDYASFLEARHAVLSRSSRIDWPAVLDRLEAVRRGSPDLIDAYVLEASVARYLFQAGHQEDYLHRAREVLAAAQRVRPGDPRAILARVDLDLAAGDLEGAAAALADLAAAAPLHPNLVTYQALLAERQGEADRAMAMLTAATTNRPSCWRLAALADMEMRHGRFAAARSHLGAAHERAPTSITILERRARLELLHGDAQRAEQLYLDLVSRSPQPQYLANLGSAQMLLGRYHEALEHYQDAESGGLRHPIVTFNLAECHALLGDHTRARALYEHALEIILQDEPGADGKLLGYASVCLAQLGRHREALATSDRALAASPQSPEVAFTSSLVQALSGDSDAARESMARAVGLGMSRDWFRLPWFSALAPPDEPVPAASAGKGSQGTGPGGG